MLQMNKYKKQCQLTDSEIKKITDFFSEMFQVDRILDIHLYLDEYSRPTCVIEGFDDPISAVLGSGVTHDLHFVENDEYKDWKKSYENFMKFYEQYMKEISAKIDLKEALQ